MMTELLNKKCEPCEGKTKAFTRQEASAYSSDVSGWKLTEDARGIYRELILKDFMAAITLINQIAAIAEQENHHPDIHLVSYCKLRIDLSTHAINGLSENDFILAAKINALPIDEKT